MPASRSLPKRTPAALVIVAAAAALGVQNINVQRTGRHYEVQCELPNGHRMDFGDGATKEEALQWLTTSIPSALARFPATT